MKHGKTKIPHGATAVNAVTGERKIMNEECDMSTATIEVGEELGRFESRAQWINHAQRVYRQAYQKLGSKDVITLDSATPRRVMLRGLQFNNAHDDCTYPAVIYAINSDIGRSCDVAGKK